MKIIIDVGSTKGLDIQVITLFYHRLFLHNFFNEFNLKNTLGG